MDSHTVLLITSDFFTVLHYGVFKYSSYQAFQTDERYGFSSAQDVVKTMLTDDVNVWGKVETLLETELTEAQILALPPDTVIHCI
jgi:hypothetical protein